MFNAPDIFSNIPDIKKIYEINEKQIDELENAVTQLDNDIFFETMSEERIERWEKILSIVNSKNSTLEDRRIKIHAKVIEKLPYTYRNLMKRMDVLCGEGNYRIDYEYVKLTIILNIFGLNMAEDVQELLEKIIPLNMSIHTVCDAVREIKAEQYLYGNVTVTKHYNIS